MNITTQRGHTQMKSGTVSTAAKGDAFLKAKHSNARTLRL